jgi:ubiquinone/menaquinone biosynthesis C-methylase UbiE
MITTHKLPKEAEDELRKNQKKPPHLLISDWLNEFEAKQAKEFHRRTGLDYKTLLKQIIEAADPHPGMRVLELAAGTGMIARHLVGLVGSIGKIYGVDSTKERIEQARLDAQSAKVGTRIEWRVAQLNHLPFAKDDLDLVTCGFSFNQLAAQDLFSESARILKPEGVLLIAAEVGAPAGARDLTQKLKRHYQRFIKRAPEEPQAHYYSSEELTELLNAAGFRQIIIRGFKSDSTIATRNFSLIKAVK